MFRKSWSGNQRLSYSIQAGSTQPNRCILPYDNKTKSYAFIDDIHIKTLLQELASHVYSLIDKEVLVKLTTYSIRGGGACVTLHVINKDTSFIHFRLCWCLEDSKMYIFNVVALAVQYYEAHQAKIDY